MLKIELLPIKTGPHALFGLFDLYRTQRDPLGAAGVSIVNGSNEIVIIVICIIDLNLLLKAEYWAIPTVETSQESFTTYVNFS